MNKYLAPALLAAAVLASTSAHAQTTRDLQSASKEKTLREASSETGSILRKTDDNVVWSSKIPPNKTYAQLTPEQKNYFHSMYESVAPGDEPPFPLEGMKPIIAAITKAQAKRRAHGTLSLAVTVGPDGVAKQAAEYGSVSDPEMTKFAASILLMTKYKPALCSGQPCTMQFPFNLELKNN